MKSQVKRTRGKGMDLKLYEWMTRYGVGRVVYGLVLVPAKVSTMRVPLS